MTVLTIAFGLMLLVYGLYGYLGRGAPRHFPLRFKINGFYGLTPFGAGCVLFGAGRVMWGWHPVMDILLGTAFSLCCLGVVLMFWHPRWIRPWWLEDESTWL